MKKLSKSVSFVINIAVLILSVISIIGLLYLTKFAFKAKSITILNKSTTCVEDMDNTKLNFSKVTVVLLWLQIILNLVASLWNMTT